MSFKKRWVISLLCLLSFANSSFSQQEFIKLTCTNLDKCLKHLHGVRMDGPVLRSKVEAAWFASALNPSWGNRYLVTIRLLCVDQGEGNFYSRAVCVNKNNGTVDVGECQVNSVHWWGHKTTWQKFCHKYGFKDDPANLFDVRINFMFAAYLNEMFIKHHERTYQFDNTSERKYIYGELLKELKPNDIGVSQAIGRAIRH